MLGIKRGIAGDALCKSLFLGDEGMRGWARWGDPDIGDIGKSRHRKAEHRDIRNRPSAQTADRFTGKAL